MRVAYVDPFSGASGDMLLGALIDAGANLDDLNRELSALGIPDARVLATPTSQHAIAGTHATVPAQRPPLFLRAGLVDPMKTPGAPRQSICLRKRAAAMPTKTRPSASSQR